MANRVVRSPFDHRRKRRVGQFRRFLILCFVLATTAVVLPGTLTSVTPSGASPGVMVSLTGTGFSTTPAQNQVTFTPAGGGEPKITLASASTTVDATRGIRRLAVRVPAGLPAGPTSVAVLNTGTGEASTTATFELVTLALPDRTTGVVGAQNLGVRISGSSNAKFVSGTTRPAFGPGITVVTTTVESPTSLIATVNIAPTAAPGPRTISITSSTQSLLLADAFHVMAAPSPNAVPVANANGPYAGNLNEAIAFSSAGSTDADRDPLTFAWTFGDGGTSSGANPSHTYLAPGQYPVTLTVSDGKGGSNTATTSATVVQPNRSPQFTSSPLLTAGEGRLYSHQLTATDPDDDPLTFSLVAGPPNLTVSASGLVEWTPGANDVGARAVQVQVSDGRGGADTQAYAIDVTPAVQLTGIDVAPAGLRLTEIGASAALTVTGTRSDQSTLDLTPGATGTTYESSNTGVATVSPDGVVTAVANGSAVITARNSGFSDTTAVTVEIGVILESLDLTPPVITLRALSATAATTLRGSFSDGSVRDLTNAPGTAFSIDPATVATINATGVVTAVGPGVATVTARHEGRTATAQAQVILAAGTAFLRGEVFDDTRGVPLAQASATVVGGGLNAVAAGQPVPADDRGQFVIPSGLGATFVRVERNGFTSVDRVAEPVDNAVTTLLDARLTPLDGRINLLQSVFGGQASSTDGSATLVVPPGSLDADGALRLTPVSNQGLQGVLPIGWSPIAAVDIQPAGRQFAQAATLRLPHVDTLAAGATVVVVRYDATNRRWVVQPPGQVSPDRRSISTPVAQTGQFAFLIADEAPFTPPPAVLGEPLVGLATPTVPGTSTATGEVIPRSAPPATDVRAVGTVILQPAVPLPSGAVLRARVEEQFDLLDSTRVRPLPFVQDLVLYARPRLGNPGTLATRLPITPTLPFTIQQLSLGQVKLDLTIDEPLVQNAIVGGTGGSLTDEAGDTLEIPAGALLADLAIGLRPLAAGQLSIPIPEGFTSLGGVLIDLVGTTFTQPALLTINRPSGLDLARQIVLAQAITDISGGRRLKVVGLGAVDGTRIGVQTTLGPLTFEGVRSGGEYVFLQPQQPLGFVGGTVNSPTATPQALAQVSSTTAPFVFVTGASGTFVVAGRTGVATTVGALDAAGAAGEALATLAAANDTAAVALTLAVTAPAVVAVAPSANATNVALDSSIVVDFSKPIDPATVTANAVTLRAGPSVVSTQVIVSANRRRITISPTAPLAGLTAYSVALTSDIRDQAGNPLIPFTGSTFTTLDPSKPEVLALGLITATLPDEDGLTLITGAPGAADGGAAVVATNLRTQSTTTVLALANGSFRVRIAVVVGDEVALTFRDAKGRETTVTISQLTSEDGTTAIGEAGGTITGVGGRFGRILPRALSTAGVFHLVASDGNSGPVLPSSMSAVDRFTLAMDGGAFRRLDSLTLTESQNRFAPGTAFAAPFAASGQLTVAPDFLVSASLRFTATATDRDGTRRSANGATVVVAAAPDRSDVETGFGESFPTVFLTVPKQVTPTQLVDVSAIAPAARVEFDLPQPSATDPAHTLVLGRVTTFGGEAKLEAVDRLRAVDVGGATRLRTVGRELPGTAEGGDFVVVAAPVAFVTGRANGPAAIVSIEGWPFITRTDSANGGFVLPVAANAPFTLVFTDASTGNPSGTTSGTAPATGATANLGSPLAPSSGALTATVHPDAQSVVDISRPLVFTFSEAVDPSTVTPDAFVVSDAGGARVFGRLTLSDDQHTVTFVPLRRWNFGTTYRFGVATRIVGRSGARLVQPVSGQFTTFAPAVLGTTSLGTVRAATTAGALGVAATATGITVLDMSAPLQPVSLARVAIPGGASSAGLLMEPLTDRNGLTRAGPFAIVGAGDSTTAGRLLVYDLGTPASPQLIGSTQLTTSPGVPPPAGVPDVTGAPSHLIVTPDLHALVSVIGAGVFDVSLPAVVPLDPADVARGIVARYPAAAAASATGAALLDDRIVSSGAEGVTLLDARLLRLGGAPLSQTPSGIAALSQFPFDANGDRITSGDELIDLAVVTGGADGTVQLYRTPSSGSPVLLSAIRVGTTTSAVAVDREERLAYVSAGIRGVVVVDLDGPASIQPVDVNRDGVDDRILGVVDTPGEAASTALLLARGIGVVAEQDTGMTVIRLLPPRTRFVTVNRDPVGAMTGEEESILVSGQALTTDDGIDIVVDAAVPVGESALLVLEQQTPGGIALTFTDDTTVKPLVDGLNSARIRIAPGSAIGAETRVSTRTVAGSTLSTISLGLASPDPGDATVSVLTVVPGAATIAQDVPSLQLAVAGLFSDRRTRNLTTAASGTVYSVNTASVLSVSAEGLAFPGGGGEAVVTALNGGTTGIATIVVDRPPVLAALTASSPALTIRRADTPVAAPFLARFSDNSHFAVPNLATVTFTSSDPAVASIDGQGMVTGHANGTTVLTAAGGSLSAAVEAFVDLRTPASITAIVFEPSAVATTDDAPALVVARVQGSGSLDGLPVTIEATGAATQTFTETTNIDGRVAAELTTLAAGALSLTARVVDPASGNTRAATMTVQIAAGTGDHEPNNAVGAASPLTAGVTATGHLDSAADAADFYRVPIDPGATLTATVTFGEDIDLTKVVIVIRSATGEELERITPTSAATDIERLATGAGLVISIETTGGGIDYAIESDIVQGPIAIQSVSPLAGGAGTPVTITGSGFVRDISKTLVLFGGVSGKVVSASPTQVVVLVGANAVNGPIEVVSGDRRATGPNFNVGVNGTLPPAFVLPHADGTTRRDPSSGQLLDIRRLVVAGDPVATRQQFEELAARIGAVVVGVLPATHTYVLEFPANTTFDGLAARTAQLRAEPIVTSVSRSVYDELDETGLDVIDNAGVSGSFSTARWFEIIQADRAIDAILSTPPFLERSSLKDVTVAIIDDGFDPAVPSLFTSNGQSLVTPLKEQGNAGFVRVLPPAPQVAGPGSHGTAVASLIIEPNDGAFGSGVLNSLVTTSPYRALAYAAPSILTVNGVRTVRVDRTAVYAALQHIATTPEVAVVNLSFGMDYFGDRAERDVNADAYRPHLQLLAGKVLVVASAGNSGVSANFHVPSVLSRTMNHVMSVGATEVRRAIQDRRADFENSAPSAPATAAVCSAGARSHGQSNCGPGVTIAAPGDDIGAATAPEDGLGPNAPYKPFGGTSAAAPIVAGVAAMLQTIRTGAAYIEPDVVRRILVQTGDDIGDDWAPDGPMRRLNAFKAVNAILRGGGPVPMYVSDTSVPVQGQIGAIVPIEINALTGTPDVAPGRVTPIVPLIQANGQSIDFSQPTTLTVSPTGDELYAIVKGPDPFGDGILVINTRSQRPDVFLGLSGVVFPDETGAVPPAAVRKASLQPALVVSRDGRLLYVGDGRDLYIFNLKNRKLVRSFADMPREYRARAAQLGNTLETRLGNLRQDLTGLAIEALTLSPDGRTLYAAVGSGGGSGMQPGFVLPINVDLYVDDSIIGDDYLTHGTLKGMTAAGTTLGSDEPSAIAVSPDGKSVYLINGGVSAFEGVQTQELDTRAYDFVLSGGLVGAVAPANTSNLASLTQSVESFKTTQSNAYNELLTDVIAQANSGITLLSAPGATGVFATGNVPGTIGAQSWAFPSEVVFGWNPPPGTGGRIVNQFKFSDVYAKRPFGITIRPDGGRALLSMFQTGNFAVLDLGAQASFGSPATAGVPNDIFKGIVGVTPAIKFNQSLLARRGSYDVPTPVDVFEVSSPDDRLQGTGAIEYAQNGRFAVAVHTGLQEPHIEQAALPDFANDNVSRLSLNSIGFDVEPGAGGGVDPDGNPVQSFQTYFFERGGGAVSVIQDGKISVALETLPGTNAPNTSRPYFATNPVCDTGIPLPTPECGAQVVDHLFEYQTTGGMKQPFHRPRGLALQPFVTFQSPRFGDIVGKTTTVRIRWRDSSGRRLVVDVFDLDAGSVRVGGLARLLTARERTSQAFETEFKKLFPANAGPRDAHRYRIRFRLLVQDNGGETELGTVSIDVRFQA